MGENKAPCRLLIRTEVGPCPPLASLNENFGAFHSMFEDFAGMFEKDFRSAFPSFPEEHGFPQGPFFPRFPRRSHGPEDVKRKKKPFPAGFSGDDFQEA